MYISIFFLSVLIASVSQVLLKKSAMKKYNYKFGDYLNPYVIIGYGLLFLSMMLTIFAYRGVDLKLGPVIEATGYLYIAFLGWIFLKEKISKKKLLGLFIIVLGIIISNI
jgi:drug/metabolite transporter (DMT)-like permease